MGARDAKAHGRAWQLRCHIKPATFRQLQNSVQQRTGYRLVRAVFEKTTYAYQAKIISETDVFWAAHGAGMVHLPLLPKDAVAIEMFNCGHYSYLYANLALHVGVRYFLMQLTEPWCYKPSSMYGDTRKNMSKTYAYTFLQAEPVLMQAVRYHMWQDPGDDIHGREEYCLVAQKVLHATGALPVGMTPKQWRDECRQGSPQTRVAHTDNTGMVSRRRRRARRPEELAQGNGLPGQFTRWAGLG